MSDVVNHPKHYNTGKIEVIEFLEDQKLNFHRANAVKYIARAGKKDASKEVEDLEKAIWYLRRDVEILKSQLSQREPARPNAMDTTRMCAVCRELIKDSWAVYRCNICLVNMHFEGCGAKHKCQNN